MVNKVVNQTVSFLVAFCPFVYHDKPLIIIEARFQEKLISHRQAVNKSYSCLHMRRAGSKNIAGTKKKSYFIDLRNRQTYAVGSMLKGHHKILAILSQLV